MKVYGTPMSNTHQFKTGKTKFAVIAAALACMACFIVPIASVLAAVGAGAAAGNVMVGVPGALIGGAIALYLASRRRRHLATRSSNPVTSPVVLSPGRAH